MLVEPPRPCVPARAGTPHLTASPVVIRMIGARAARLETLDVLRIASLSAALVLAATSRGDIVVLAAMLSLGVGRPASALATAGALGAALVRWGSPSLGAIADAQVVLGPAGWTGSNAAVASAWLAGAALVLASRPRRRATGWSTALAAAPFAVAAADVVVGPSTGAAVLLRIAASAVALVLAVGVSRWRRGPDAGCVLAVAALVAAGLAR